MATTVKVIPEKTCTPHYLLMLLPFGLNFRDFSALNSKASWV